MVDELINNVINEVVNPILYLMTALAVVMFVYVVFKKITDVSAGKVDSKDSKSNISLWWALIGLLVVVLASGLTRLVGVIVN